MIVHRLEITDFKSYAGTQIIGPFDSHFSCIIGPNGNGKSNIIDALLFVFGFKSAKLRQDNLTSLIHRSACHTAESCHVCIVFREGCQEDQVSRTIKKKGQNYYQLNGQKINWSELKQYLISKGIDLHKNLFIILQGEVERLCELNPDQLVQHLQYISGSDEFKEPVEEKEKQFIQNGVAKDEAYNIFMSKRRSYGQVRTEAEVIIQWIRHTAKILHITHLLIKKSLEEYQRQMEENRKQHHELVENHEKGELNLGNKKQELKLLKEEQNKAQKELRRLQIMIEKHESEKQGLEQAKNKVERQITFQRKDLTLRMSEREKCISEIADVKTLVTNNAQVLEEYQAIKQQVDKIQAQHERNTAMKGVCRKCWHLEKKLTQYSAQVETKTDALQQKQKRLTEIRQTLSKHDLMQASTSNQRAQLKQQLKLMLDEEYSIKMKHEKSVESLKAIQNQIKETGKQDQALSGVQKVVKELKLANQLKIVCPDFKIATLREQVLIEKQYLHVINALFPHLDFIVVEKTKQAEELASYLSQKRIGRMTFLIEEHILSTQSFPDRFKVPQGTKRIFDLCKPIGAKASKILYWVVGDTLIAKNLEQAMSVAYSEPRNRVITHKGEFIDLSGTITVMKLKSGDIAEDKEILHKKIELIRNQKQKLQSKMDELSRQIPKLKETINHMTEDSQTNQEFLQEMKVECQSLQSAITAEQQLIRKIEKEQRAAINQLNENKQKFNADQEYPHIIAAIDRHEKQRSNIRKIEGSTIILEQLQTRSTELSVKISKLETKIHELQTQSEKVNPEIQIANDNIFAIAALQAQVKNTVEQMEQKQFILGMELDDLSKEIYKKNGIKETLQKSKDEYRSLHYHHAIQLSKYEESFRQIKELYVSSQQQFQDQSYRMLLGQYPFTQQLLAEAVVCQGEKEISFEELIPGAQRQSIMSSLPSDNVAQLIKKQNTLLFDALEVKKLKFLCSVETEKLQRIQKEHRLHPYLPGNLNSLSQYPQISKDFVQCEGRFKNLQETEQQLSKQLLLLRAKRINKFTKAFNEINIHLHHIYQRMTGGRAQMSFIDSLNPLSGVEFTVRPVNKSWKSVQLLSGGEKTLTSLSLIFACEEVKKFPFYFMDEIDAALDYRNTGLLAQYIESKKQTQHIVVSLRKNMYQLCNKVVGVYKVNDQTNTVALQMEHIMK